MLGAEHATLAQRLRARVSVPVRDATLAALLCHRLALHTWKRLPAMPGAKLRAVAERRSLVVRHRAEHKAALVLCRPPRAPCPRELVHEVVRASRAALTQWRCVRAMMQAGDRAAGTLACEALAPASRLGLDLRGLRLQLRLRLRQPVTRKCKATHFVHRVLPTSS